MMDSLKVLLVDDHPLMSSGLRALPANDTEFNELGDATDGKDAIRLIDGGETHPGVSPSP